MAELSAELVKRLARQGGTDHPVITLYLNVDGREKIRPEDYKQRLDAMIREVSTKDHPKEVKEDLARIADYVNNDFERGNNRGLAVFVSGQGFWEVVMLTLPVEDYLVVNRSPHVRQLETLLDEHETTGVILTDKQKARLLIIELGQVVERSEVIDPLPRHDDDKGDWEKDHVRNHAEVMAHQHLRHAAQAMFEMYQRRPFSHVVMCVADELKPELYKELHDYLKQRVAGHCNLPVNAQEDEIVVIAHKLTQKAERVREAEYVDRLRAAVGSNDAAHRTNGNSVGAVAGLEHTLNAVYEKRVDTLLVSEGYAAEGWRCHACGYIATVGRKCRMCGGSMVLVDDVVEEAVEDAIGQKCRVEFCSDNADLDVMGRIGALLRF